MASSSRSTASRAGSIGRTNFVERFGLWTEEQSEESSAVVAEVRERQVEQVRFVFPDQHGILRGKAIMADAMPQALRNGVAMTTTLLVKDTSHKTVFPVWQEGAGLGMAQMVNAGDFILVADPGTFRILPWAPDTGWVLCDAYFSDGSPVPFATRSLLQHVLGALEQKGYDYVSGFECEFHLYKLEDPKMAPEHATQPAAPPETSLLWHGYNYLTEIRQDEMEPVVSHIRKALLALDLPLRSIEVEFGPSQCEVTFHPCTGMETADLAVLFRSAVKQICRRNGYHATFMCKPGMPNAFASGWHLHQSLAQRGDGANAFVPAGDQWDISDVGRQFLAGLLQHARPASAFSTPTINGYKRYQPNSLAPDRVAWGRDNKGAMLRLLGGPEDPGTRIENRVGDPAANPYLYLASQILSGLDGMERALEPPPPIERPYDDSAEWLPRNLMEAIEELYKSDYFRTVLGDTFIEWYTGIKRAEIERFLTSVTDWEHREYFEIF